MVPAFCRKVAGNPLVRIKFQSVSLFGQRRLTIACIRARKHIFTFPQDDYVNLAAD